MSPPGNVTAPPAFAQLSLRQSAENYPAIEPKQFENAFKGQVALITGSARGIGRAMAEAFAAAGYSVAITSRNADEIDSTVLQLQSRYADVKIIGVVADATKLSSLERLVTKVNTKLGIIDVLLCNAGTNTFMPFTMTEASDWWYSLEINLKSPTELTRLVLPQMRARNRGTIIYTSSRAAIADLPWTTAYGCGKTAITRFAAVLQNELDQTQKIDYGFNDNGISLFSIHPGEVETSLHTSGFPEKTRNEAPYIIEHMKALDAKRPRFEATLAAWTCVYLTSGKASKLRGKYVDCTRDIEEVQALYPSLL